MSESVSLAFTLLGGLALFLFGMATMTEGLRAAASDRLRQLLSKAGANRFAGLGVGSLGGFLVHSSAATVMLVAFVNAGLVTLAQSLPLTFGANLGTTFSMQLISFKLNDYALYAVAVGFFLRLLGGKPVIVGMGNALFGFGLIFLGMTVMSDAIRPYRDELAPFLAQVDASTWQGMLLGVGTATLITAVIQSSGATIGMCFTLIGAGVFRDIANVYPIILGAHLGTCATALLGSMGTNIEARRAALGHLIFNVMIVAIAVPLAPHLMKVVEWMSSDLLRQAANLHTVFASLGVVVLLPICGTLTKVIRWITPSKSRVPPPSFLKPELLEQPEEALQASIREARRVSEICEESHRLSGELLLLDGSRKVYRRIARNEEVIDEVKHSMKQYLVRLTRVYLSKRQAVLVQHLSSCVVELERIGDHIKALADSSRQRARHSDALFDASTFEDLFGSYRNAGRVLKVVTESFDLRGVDVVVRAERILEAREVYREESAGVKRRFREAIERKEESALAGLYFQAYLTDLDRIVRHARVMARTELDSHFWIKERKLGRPAVVLEPRKKRKRVDAKAYRRLLKDMDEEG